MKIPFPPSLPLSPSSRLAPLLDSLPLARPLARWLARWLLDRTLKEISICIQHPNEQRNGETAGAADARARGLSSFLALDEVPPSLR